MIIGDDRLWADFFPDTLIPDILNLVVDVWRDSVKPAPTEHEVPITRRLRPALLKNKNLRRIPVRILPERVVDNPVTGEEVGRIDVSFEPANSAREDIYFAIECKRLYYRDAHRRRSGVRDYVLDGLTRFVSGQYGASVLDGGMLGYVLERTPAVARGQLDAFLAATSATLRLAPGAPTSTVRVHPDLEHFESAHSLPQGTFRVHHLLLGR